MDFSRIALARFLVGGHRFTEEQMKKEGEVPPRSWSLTDVVIDIGTKIAQHRSQERNIRNGLVSYSLLTGDTSKVAELRHEIIRRK